MLYLERYQGQRKGDDMMKSAHKLPTLSLGVYILLSTTSGLAQAVVPASSHAVEDLLLQRLDALEARVRQLEARNAVLEAAQAAMPAASAPFAASPVAASLASSSASSPVSAVVVAATPVAAPAPAPAPAAADFTFRPKGMFQADYVGYNARAGGYDYSNGTDIRRARFGFDGTAYEAFKWRLNAEYVKNTVTLLDAYLQYAVTPNWSVTIGHVKTPYGLEGVTSDANQTFLEHGMAGNAFTAVGADRRVGAMVSYQSPRLNAALGLFGSGEAVKRSEATPDEGYGVNGRVAYAPILTKDSLLQIGVSGFHATNLAGRTLTIGDRPNLRVDDGKLIEVKSITGISSADSVMAEMIAARGPWSVQGEYGRLKLNRSTGLADLDFDGFYVFGSWLATGETRRVKNGAVEHIKPNTDFNPKAGHWGAVELALRYDQLDLTDRGLSPLNRKAVSWTGAINWYLNARATLLFNYIRFRGSNSPLLVTPLVNGTTARGEAFATRLQFDF